MGELRRAQTQPSVSLAAVEEPLKLVHYSYKQHSPQ
ncbi:hypothetical protein FOTG_19261 [Fusarium oxysporum f. sp. vasinfectum 25433]|uniref:Uncharacterized protein n=1 Tax=Fusarium oxysporum f. sp. vasinfectum 25433 TaxID=1089449 RepID=X0KFE7_FUSOX|nr:hypothetical protein FOTG_19261 [Fusarium oxysporum f. sp. vasinfectum 25433]